MTVLKVENLGKRYMLGHDRHALDGAHRYRSFRESLAQTARSLYGRLRHPFSPNSGTTEIEEFWALRDVSFSVEAGDRVGIIGRNGAGKSTILKILSRITEPTVGRIEIDGRIASLLEVGTGFHPELSGRENIYLNGAILGMTRAEIRTKFDEIVQFAEIEKFIDTPVKRYSSGMYVRLAFAVAAHLDAEIMIIDEVLAVGDAGFQKKCLGKMNSLSSEGRTLLFVSHQMNAIEDVCSSAMLLDHGRVVLQSTNVRAVINTYLRTSGGDRQQKAQWTAKDGRLQNPYFDPKRFFLSDVEGSILDLPVRNDTDVYVNVEFVAEKLDDALVFGFDVYDATGRHVFACNQTDTSADEWPEIVVGRNQLRTRIPPHFLNEGDYQLRLVASLFNRMWIVNPFRDDVAIGLAIRGGLSLSPYWTAKRGGVVAPLLRWETA